MRQQRIRIFLIGISLLILAHTSKSSHSHKHSHHRYETEPNPNELVDQNEYDSFIEKYSLPYFNLDSILSYMGVNLNKPKENETKSGNSINLKTDTSDKKNISENSKKENALKQTNTKATDVIGKSASDSNAKKQHHKFYSDLNNNYIRSKRQNINKKDVPKPASEEVKKNNIGVNDFSLEGNLKDINKHLTDMKAEKEKKDEVEKRNTLQNQAAKAGERPKIISNNNHNPRTNQVLRSVPATSSTSSACGDDEEALAYKNRLDCMNINEPYNYSKKTYDMNATEDTLSERLKAYNGKKSFNKESNNVAIAKANNSYAVAKGNGPGRAIASSGNGGRATAISFGGGEAISEVKHNGQAKAISHGKGSSVAKSHGQSVSEAISEGDGKALAISSDNSYSKAHAIGNSEATALSADNAIALSTANSQAFSDANAANNSSALANANSKAKSLAVATDNAFANATANANSVALSTASQNSIANSNANADAEALAKASGNGITNVLANANSKAIAESKDNSVVIVESSANSKAIGEANSPVLPAAAPDAGLVTNKPVLKLRGSDLNRNHNYGSFLMIKKIEIPKFQENRNMFDYLNMNLDDDSSILVNTNVANGGLFSFFSGGAPSKNTSESSTASVPIVTPTVETTNNHLTPVAPLSDSGTRPIEATKQQIIDAIINAPNTEFTTANTNTPISASEPKKPLLNETTQAPSPNEDLKPDQNKLSENNAKFDLSKLDTKSDFVKDLIKKINNEDCILNYDAGPIFNTNAKQPETINTKIDNNDNNNDKENASILKSSLVNNKATKNAEQQPNNNNLPEGKQIYGITNLNPNNQMQNTNNNNNSNNNNGEGENKSFLKANENGVDKNLAASNTDALPENLQNMNLAALPTGSDGMVIDKQNNRILVDNSDGKNRKIRVNQSLNFSKNQVSRNFNTQNSDFNMKNSVENLSDTEAKSGKNAELAEEDHEQEPNRDDDFDSEDDEFDDKKCGKRKSPSRRSGKSSKSLKNDRKRKSKPSSSDDDIADFDRKYIKSGSSSSGRNKSDKNEFSDSASHDNRSSIGQGKPKRKSATYADEDVEDDALYGSNDEKAAFKEAGETQKRNPRADNNFVNRFNEAERPQQNSNNNNNNENDDNNLTGKIPANNILKSANNEEAPIKPAIAGSAQEEFSKLKSPVSSEAAKDKIHSIWTNTKFKAIDIACSNKGDIMAIGEDKKLYKYDIQKNVFDLMKQDDEISNLKHIDLGSDATPFAITENGNTYFSDSKSNWIRLPGCATDISIGKKGEIYKLGCTNRPRGYSIYQFSCFIDDDSSSGGNKITKNLDNYLRNYYKNLKCKWNKFPGFAKTIVVGNDGLPFTISKKNNFVYKSDGTYWDAVSGVKAKDISVSNENVLFIVGMDGKVYEVLNDKDSEVVLFDSIAAEKISTGPYSRPSIIKSADGLVYTSSKI
jgi:hypothetical protein